MELVTLRGAMQSEGTQDGDDASSYGRCEQDGKHSELQALQQTGKSKVIYLNEYRYLGVKILEPRAPGWQ
jgi:hypothetical protein